MEKREGRARRRSEWRGERWRKRVARGWEWRRGGASRNSCNVSGPEARPLLLVLVACAAAGVLLMLMLPLARWVHRERSFSLESGVVSTYLDAIQAATFYAI